jgi:predicted nicotinamide N-methyase
VAGAAELEGLDVAVRIWDTAGDEPLPSADLAVFAEALYDPGLARAAADRTVQALAAGSRVLVTDPGRYARAEYQRVLGAAGVHVEFEDAVVRVPGDAQPARVGIALLEPAAATP